MNLVKPLILGCGLLLGAQSIASVDAGHYASRQYYSSWHSYPQRHYYYRSYYYNPYKKVYWGRCSTHYTGEEQYSLLAEGDRRGNIEDIPEKAFPAMAKMPTIPDAKDNAKVDLPPDDLPTQDTALPQQ